MSAGYKVDDGWSADQAAEKLVQRNGQHDQSDSPQSCGAKILTGDDDDAKTHQRIDEARPGGSEDFFQHKLSVSIGYYFC